MKTIFDLKAAQRRYNNTLAQNDWIECELTQHYFAQCEAIKKELDEQKKK